MNIPRTGDTYKWHSLTIRIGKVDPDGKWAMIEIDWPEHDRGALGKDPKRTTTKQQPTPGGKLPDDWEPVEPAPGPDPAQEAVLRAHGALRAWMETGPENRS